MRANGDYLYGSSSWAGITFVMPAFFDFLQMMKEIFRLIITGCLFYSFYESFIVFSMKYISERTVSFYIRDSNNFVAFFLDNSFAVIFHDYIEPAGISAKNVFVEIFFGKSADTALISARTQLSYMK